MAGRDAHMAGNFHERLESHEVVEGPSDRAFGLTVGGILSGLGLLKAILSGGVSWVTAALLVVGGGLVLVALVAPSRLAVLNRWWMRLGLLLFRVVNPIVMFLIYVLSVVPIGLVMRWAGKDPLRLRRDPQAASYWLPRDPPGPEPASMRNQF